jgi:cytoplasmic iron level regulating protein YaaA (DUF328/UPF0246 family)
MLSRLSSKTSRAINTRFIIDNALNEPEAIKGFKTDGYRYNKAESSAREWVFTRENRPI